MAYFVDGHILEIDQVAVAVVAGGEAKIAAVENDIGVADPSREGV